MSETPHTERPPMARLEFNLSVSANSVAELTEKLDALALDVALREEGEWNVSSGRGWTYYTTFDPDMTAERYDRELSDWWRRRKANRRAAGSAGDAGEGK